MTSLQWADPGLFFWLFAALHLGGLASMLLTRLPRGRRWQSTGQVAFVSCLLVVGLVTMFTIVTQHSAWVWSGTTFSLMAVGGTIDLGPGRAAGF